MKATRCEDSHLVVFCLWPHLFSKLLNQTITQTAKRREFLGSTKYANQHTRFSA